jgi:hypothetical protein
MTPDACGEPCRTTGPAHGPLQPTVMGVMPADESCTGGFRQLVGRKHLWPQPKAAGTGVCSYQGKRSQDGAIPLGDALRMYALDTRSMFLEWADQAGGPHGDPILHAVALPHHDLLLGKVEIFHAEP